MMAALLGPDDVSDQLEDQSRDKSLSELAKSDLGKSLEPYDRKMELVAGAARRDHMQWDTELRQRGSMAILTYLNQLRIDARALSLQARWQIARHDWPQARYTLQTGFSMCDQFNDHPVLVQGLVQCGILDVLLDRVE